jgi:ribosome-associated toxin RatA of RatAB toxin-antitoxin module
MFRTRATGGRFLPAAALFLLLAASGAMAEPPAPLTVIEQRGVYTVIARFAVEQSASATLAVLTDYEQIPRFMPGVRTSHVLERSSGRAIVEQEAISTVMMFSKRVHLVLEIDEHPDALIFHDRCGRSFVRYEGAWRVSERGRFTAVTYELTAEPSFEVPGFLLKRLLRRDSTQMIERLQREIALRGASAVSFGVEPAK